MRILRGIAVCSMALVTSVMATAALADDPLDDLDGTEGWDAIDTSSVDEAEAWRRWRRDLRRWEAGRARLDAERSRMAELRRRLGNSTEEDDTNLPPEDEDLQARLDAARRMEGTGDHQRRDDEGQSIDNERPWRSR